MIKDRIINAYIFAKEKHEGQFRKFSGLSYFAHPKGVARKVEDLVKDEDMIIAALLHDIVEDCNVTLSDIESRFGSNVAKLVDELTTPNYDKSTTTKKDILVAKMVSMSDDAFTLKLLDRLDNVEWMDKDCKTVEQQAFVKRYSEETVGILNEIKKLKKDKSKLHNAIIRMIEANIDYIQIKHLW